MTHDLFRDPRNRPSSLLVQVDTTAIIVETSRHEKRHRIQGEILLDVEGPWVSGASEVFVRLRRLGLSSAGPLIDSPIGEISISSSRGSGTLRLVSAMPPTVELDLQVEARVTYLEIVSRQKIPLESDSHAALAEHFTGSLSARLRLDAALPIERLLSLVEGHLSFNKIDESLGALQSFRLDLGNLPAVPLRTNARPTINIRLRPVRFPLARGLQTGKTWDDQLAKAKAAWSHCAVSFQGLDFIDHRSDTLAYSRNILKIFAAHRENGVVEVFFVASQLTGKTFPAGDSMVAIIIPEPADENLLAHELSHVLGGCDPAEGKCGRDRWEGVSGTVTDPLPPISGRVTDTICTQARDFPQPLLRTILL